MKSVLRSIKPYWLYLILIGKKSVEVGKDCPKSKDWNRVVELYCSKDKKSFNRIPEKDKEWMQKYLGKVVCRFVCDNVSPKNCSNGIATYFENEIGTCLSDFELRMYSDGVKPLWFWHISDLVIYNKPKELQDFLMPTDGTKDCCDYFQKDGIHNYCGQCPYYDPPGYYVEDDCYAPFDCTKYRPLFRPPQSWCYVEELI